MVTDHCNLRCTACNHASPAVRRWSAQPEDVYRDLTRMAQVYRPPMLLLIGGEPLLHKDLIGIIEAARASHISPRYRLLTNGSLLHRMPEAAWSLLDEVEVSMYPGVEPSVEMLKMAEKKAKKLIMSRFEQFRLTFAARGTSDPELVGKVYRACKSANLWGCHGIRDGYFYKCPQSIYMDQLTGADTSSDRVPIHSGPSLQAEILALVNSHEPLVSCRTCAGTCGKQVAHTQAPPGQWRDHIDLSLEDIVDFPWLETCLSGMSIWDDCKILDESNPPCRKTH